MVKLGKSLDDCLFNSQTSFWELTAEIVFDGIWGALAGDASPSYMSLWDSLRRTLNDL